MRYRYSVALLVSSLITAPAVAAAVLPQALPSADAPVFTRPERKPTPRSAPSGPPALPEGAATVPPLALEVEVHRTNPGGDTAVVRQRVVRASDRMHVQTADREWWFRQNPVDPRRVSALLVDHPSRTIVFHDESELRNMLGIGGWADLLLMGVDPADTAPASATDGSRTLSGLVFRRHARQVPGGAHVEIWWNEAHLLASRVVVRHEASTTTTRVTKLAPAGDDARLRSPVQRYPGYKQIDLSEWLEGH